jgi:hypothetical protein
MGWHPYMNQSFNGSWYKPNIFPAGSLNLAVISGASTPMGWTILPPCEIIDFIVDVTLSTMM